MSNKERKEFIRQIKEKFPLDIKTMTVSGADISELETEERRWVLLTLTQEEREIVIPHIWEKLKESDKYIL